MALADQWDNLTTGLPEGWSEARVRLVLEEVKQIDRAAALLGPLQPFRAEAGALSFRVVGSGGSPSPHTARRLLARLDAERLHGTLTIVSTETAAPAPAPSHETTLAESWTAALATLPGDWSDLLGEIELLSSDYLEPAALRLAPLNPRRVGEELLLRFRSASHFGYGASPGMVNRCLERCDAFGVRGSVRVLRVLSDTRPAGTQGPVWQIDGHIV